MRCRAAPNAERRLLVTATAALTAAVSLSLPAPVASAAPGVGGFTVVPVPTAADQASRGYFNPTLPAGAARAHRVLVRNQTDKPIDLILSAVDGRTGETSGSVFANRQDAVHEAGTWLTLGVTTLRVAPRARTTVDFTVTVPAGSTAGDHLAGLAVENAAPTTTGSGVQINQVLRMVVGVLVRVPGPASFRPTLQRLRLEELPGPEVGAVVIGLANAGGALGKPTLVVSLAGPDDYRRSLTRVLDTVLPGDAINFPFAWPDDLAPGRYQITVTIFGDPAGAGTTLRGEGVVTAPLLGTDRHPVAVEGTRTGLDARWALVLAGALALVLGGLAIRFRRTRQRPLVRHRRPATNQLEQT